MMKESIRKNYSLPSWLWFWLILYILNFPIQVRDWKFYYVDSYSFSFDLLKLANVPEIMPSLALLFGVILIFIPLLRATKLEKEFKLEDFDSAFPKLPERNKEVALEVEKFLRLHAPNLQIKANFRLLNQEPFLYASGSRKSSIALFGNILRLWKSNQEVAEAVILHEIGHYRNGDASVIGVGSFFEWVLRNCFTISVLFFLIPFTLLIVGQEITYVSGCVQEELIFLGTMRNIGTSTTEIIYDFLSFFFSIIIHELKNLALIYIPGILSIMFGLLLWAVNIFVLPIVGIWCAELNADRFMMKISTSKEASTMALDRISEHMSFSQWLLSRVTHPPKTFRKWMLLDTKYTESNIVFLLLFPFACFLKLIILLSWAFLNYMTSSVGDMNEFSSILSKLVVNSQTYLRTVSLVWLFSSVLILAWPVISVYWVSFFSGETEYSNWENYKQHILSAGVVLCLFAASYFI